MNLLALEGLTTLPEVETIPPAADWKWIPSVADLDEVITRLSATKSPFTSRNSGYMSGIDHGEMY